MPNSVGITISFYGIILVELCLWVLGHFKTTHNLEFPKKTIKMMELYLHQKKEIRDQKFMPFKSSLSGFQYEATYCYHIILNRYQIMWSKHTILIVKLFHHDNITKGKLIQDKGKVTIQEMTKMREPNSTFFHIPKAFNNFLSSFDNFPASSLK